MSAELKIFAIVFPWLCEKKVYLSIQIFVGGSINSSETSLLSVSEESFEGFESLDSSVVCEVSLSTSRLVLKSASA